MWTLKIGILCLVLVIRPGPIESSVPDDNSPGFSRPQKLPIRRSTQQPASQSSASPSTHRQPSQPAEWELSLSSSRYSYGREFHSSIPNYHSTEHPSATHLTASTSSAPAEPSFRSRSRSPYSKPPSYSTLFGIKIDDLRFQRFFPVNNSNRELVIRMYDFRPGTQIYLKDQPGRISEPLTGVQFILSALNGDALALVEKQKNGHTSLRGLFMPPAPKGLRAKINIFTHQVSLIEPEEANDTPLGKTVFNNYLTKKTVDTPVEPFYLSGSTPHSIPLFHKLFGLKMEELQFYRFFPVRDPSWELGIQAYTFPPDVGIHLRIGKNHLDPRTLTGEQYILSDMNGNAVAIVKKQANGQSQIRGLYLDEPSESYKNRVTMNIFTNHVRKMKDEEVYATPITRNNDIRNYYNMRHVGIRFAPRRNAG